MRIWVRALSFLAVAGLSFGFAAVLMGMISVFLVGLRADLRVRELLQRYRHALEDRE